MEELGKKQENSRLYYDSQSAIHLAKNSAFHSKTNYIQLRYHFIRSVLEDVPLHTILIMYFHVLGLGS
jgi:hypothetical protein